MERKWWPTGKNVCRECLSAPSLQQLIDEKASDETECSYCYKLGAVSLDYLLEHRIMPAIWAEYTEAGDELGWSDGEWVGSPTDTYDLIEELFGGYDESGGECLTEDLRESIVDVEWCRQDYYGVKPEEAPLFRWRGFARIVKHHSRYFFGSITIEKEPSEQYETDVLGFLAEMKTLIEGDLLRTILPGEFIYRARVDVKKHDSLKELGAPPVLDARFSNRMTPAGISMFYGGFDSETAKEEVGPVRDKKVLSLASFRLVRGINIVDFSRLPVAPDFFDLGNRDRRYLCMFLYSFVRELNAPVEKDGREHIEYVPTQVLTEYLKSNLNVDGMIFPSARNHHGKCIVLWSNDFVPDWRGNASGLELVDVKYEPEDFTPSDS